RRRDAVRRDRAYARSAGRTALGAPPAQARRRAAAIDAEHRWAVSALVVQDGEAAGLLAASRTAASLVPVLRPHARRNDRARGVRSDARRSDAHRLRLQFRRPGELESKPQAARLRPAVRAERAGRAVARHGRLALSGRAQALR